MITEEGLRRMAAITHENVLPLDLSRDPKWTADFESWQRRANA